MQSLSTFLLDRNSKAAETGAAEDGDQQSSTWYSSLQHFLSRGHDGAVLCVGTSNTVDYIVSGGVDNTMRVWIYDGSKEEYTFELDGTTYTGSIVKDVDIADTAGGNMTNKLEYFASSNSSTPSSSDQPDVETMYIAFDEFRYIFRSSDGRVVPYEKHVIRAATDAYLLCAVLSHSDEPAYVPSIRGVPRVIEGLGKWVGFSRRQTRDGHRGVTAVACAGSQGPFISGTATGAVSILRLPRAGDDVTALGVPILGCITDLQAAELEKNVDPVKGPWLLAIASEDHYARLFMMTSGETLALSQLCEDLEHSGPVHKVRHIPNVGPLSTRVATCAGNEVFLWNLRGERLCVLTSPEPTAMSELAVSNSAAGTLLFAGSNGNIGVWVMDPTQEEIATDPIAAYRYSGSGIAVAQGDEYAEYAVHVRDDKVVVEWELLATKPEKLNKMPTSWWQLLVKPGKERIVAEMLHQGPVNDIKLAEDDIEGPVLLTASADGIVSTWVVEGPDKGEICGQLRSLSIFEVLMPPVLLFTTFVQLASFAFGPATQWNADLKTTITYGTRVALLGTTVDFELDIKKRDKFYWEFHAVLWLMTWFLIIELTGLYDIVGFLRRLVQSTARFKEADLAGTKDINHLAKLLLGYLQSSMKLLMWFSCTIGVAPVFKVCAQALTCSHASDDKWYLRTTGGNEVECMMMSEFPVGLRWKGDTEWSYKVALIYPLMLVYFVGLAPYAVVAGDATYVQRSELSEPARWRGNARRKATVVDMGIFHPDPANVFAASLFELASKALLPIIELVPNPVAQMTLSCMLMIVMYLQARKFPPYIDKRYVAVARGLRKLIVWAMVCGLITVLIHNRVVPVILLLLSTSVVAMNSAREIRDANARRFVISRSSTSDVPQYFQRTGGRKSGCQYRTGITSTSSWFTMLRSIV